jgi:hypothetical protein
MQQHAWADSRSDYVFVGKFAIDSHFFGEVGWPSIYTLSKNGMLSTEHNASRISCFKLFDPENVKI